MRTETVSISILKARIEEKIGRKIVKPKDFNFLRDTIFEQCHVLLSSTTLKRIWGYNHDGGTPRTSSLTPLAQYLGYEDWNHFALDVSKGQSNNDGLQKTFIDNNNDLHHKEQQIDDRNYRRHSWISFYAVLAFAVLSVIIGLAFGTYHKAAPKENTQNFTSGSQQHRVLRRGEDFFHSIDDYLPLFGITSSDTAYFRQIPNLKEIYVWGPEYGNPVWHNEGDKSQLMPTITEYWTPLEGTKEYISKEYVELANEKLFYERLEKDEIRVTFMKDITEGYYTFLGIYKMDRQLSSKQKTVWRRVADECDLSNLESLVLQRTASFTR